MFKKLIAVFAGMAGLTWSQGSGQISGVVSDETGKAVAGAYVTYLRTPYAKDDKAPVGEGQYTDTTGGFAFTKLIAATYTFCVQTPPDWGYPPLCDWTLTPPSAAIKNGGKAVVNITIQHGVRVEIRLDDPKKLLPTPEDKVSSASVVRFGARTPDGWLHAAQLRSRDDSGQDYWVIVPALASFTPHLFGTGQDFKDDKGAAVARNGADISVQLSAEEKVKKLKFQVAEKGK